jgi:hypothetical protein
MRLFFSLADILNEDILLTVERRGERAKSGTDCDSLCRHAMSTKGELAASLTSCRSGATIPAVNFGAIHVHRYGILLRKMKWRLCLARMQEHEFVEARPTILLANDVDRARAGRLGFACSSSL